MNAQQKSALRDLTQALDDDPLPQTVAVRLRRARAQATSTSATRRGGMLEWSGAATFATAAGLALVLSLAPTSPLTPPDLSADPQAAVFVYTEDAELIENLEFYDWLALQGHAG